ncbi:hypothetical protein [Flavobacterium flavigenum]|uniref:hypothetical protein n=1 Tax=Flavobacterium flavigenum TaxID=3003258 RepID=UPI0022ABFEAD|nr:hypothetical protein [Flavobacterium flavigenum]
MKNFLLFIAILVNNSIFACGFYPFGEDIRYSFLSPANFNYYSYSEFNYSSNTFYPNANGVYPEGTIEENEKLWMEYCHNKISVEAIRNVLYSLKEEDINEKSTNEMLQYFYKTKNIEAINYLKFAKTCEFFNGVYEDPWERKEGASLPKREELIDKAIFNSNKIKNRTLKLRYTFLAIRLAYYNNDFDQIKSLFDTVFKSQKKDILYYWSLYFRTFAEKDKALSNFYAAQVFVNAPDKRFMIAQQFDSKISLDTVLKYAKNNEERANVYFLAGIKKSDQALFCLEQVYKYNPKFEGLSFLLLREINKIEDWVFTPYYSLFNPSVSKYNYWAEEDKDNSIQDILNRVQNDRAYAGKVLQFVNNIKLKKINDPVLWKIGKAYLSFVTQNHQSCLNEITAVEKSIFEKDSLYDQIQIIKALALTANQEIGKALILEEVKPVLLKNQKNKKFLFAIGRELEYKKNRTEAAFLYSKLNHENTEYVGYYDSATAVWKTLQNRKSSYRDFYTDYFDYIDVIYSPEDVQEIVAQFEDQNNILDSFSKWKQSYIKNEIPRLYDLIGTKYIRQNNLELAAEYFGKLDKDKLANYSDCLWEKPNCKESDMFDANPFFVLKYTPEFISQDKIFKLNKRSITEHLILYLKKAAEPKEENKDYYYFLVANAYYNMTQNGNSWMMRRYYWHHYTDDAPFEDEREFYESNLAQKYYLLALKNAKTDQFKALCLRMIGRCEKNKLEYQNPNNYDNTIENYDDFLLSKNKYYQDLKSNYADDYEILMSSCSSFEEYFKSRR